MAPVVTITPAAMAMVLVMLPMESRGTPTSECPRLQPPAMPAPMPISSPPAPSSTYRRMVSPRNQNVPERLAAMKAPGISMIRVMGIQSELPPSCPVNERKMPEGTPDVP